MKVFVVLAVLFAAVSAQSPCTAGTIVDVAKKQGYNRLVELVSAAGLTEGLQGEGPFTVFAPTDEAIDALGKEKIEELKKDIEQLKTILRNHVVDGKVLSTDLTDEMVAKTRAESSLRFNKYFTEKDLWTVNGKKIVTADVEACNGVIHVVDQVIVPVINDEDKLPKVIGSAGGFKTFLTAVETAGLVETLNGDGPFTVMCPSDAAFDKLPTGTLDSLLKDIPALKNILLRHVIPDTFFVNGITTLDTKSSSGETVSFIKDTTGIRFKTTVDGETKEATVTRADIIAFNGVCHEIDTVV